MNENKQNGERRRTERLKANAGAVVMAAILVFSVFAGVGIVATQPITENQSGTAEAVSSDIVVSGADDNTVKATYKDNGTVAWTFSGHTSYLRDVSVGPDGDVYTAGNDGTVYRLHAENGTVVWSYSGHGSAVSSVVVNDTVVYSSSLDDTVKKLDKSTGGQLDSHSAADWPRKVTIGPNGDVYTALSTGKVKRIDSGDMSTVWETTPTGLDYGYSIAVSESGKVFVGNNAEEIYKFDASDGSLDSSNSLGSGSYIEEIVISDGSGYAALQSTNRVVQFSLSDLTSGWEYSHTAAAGSLAVLDSGAVVSGDDDGDIVVHNADGTAATTLTPHGTSNINGLASAVEWAYTEPATPTPTETKSGPAPKRIELDTRNLFKPNSTHPYSVTYINETGSTVESADVTSNASVNTSNTTLLSVNTTAFTLSSINESSINATVNVTANYTTSGGTKLTTTKEVVIASATVKNLELLPTGTWRVTAILADSYFQVLLVAMFAAIIMTRFTSAFGGLAGAEMVLVIGWFAGYVPWVFAALGLFVALFIGLNLAANIDYTVRR